ncbi:DUF6251 family protein [Streptomyces albidoflavus]
MEPTPNLPVRDRTTQRIALGTGIGAGTVAAGVYFGPLLVGVLTSMAVSLAVVALVAVATAWGLVTVVRTVAQDGDQATKNLRKARRRGRPERPGAQVGPPHGRRPQARGRGEVPPLKSRRGGPFPARNPPPRRPPPVRT